MSSSGIYLAAFALGDFGNISGTLLIFSFCDSSSIAMIVYLTKLLFGHSCKAKSLFLGDSILSQVVGCCSPLGWTVWPGLLVLGPGWRLFQSWRLSGEPRVVGISTAGIGLDSCSRCRKIIKCNVALLFLRLLHCAVSTAYVSRAIHITIPRIHICTIHGWIFTTVKRSTLAPCYVTLTLRAAGVILAGSKDFRAFAVKF